MKIRFELSKSNGFWTKFCCIHPSYPLPSNIHTIYTSKIPCNHVQLKKMHGLETWQKYNAAHYLCWGRFMQKYGSYLVTCVLYLLQINQWSNGNVQFGQLFPLCMNSRVQEAAPFSVRSTPDFRNSNGGTEHGHMTVRNCCGCPNFKVGAARTQHVIRLIFT